MGGTGCFATTGKVVQTHQNYRFAENRAFSALCPTGIDASVTACTIPARRAERDAPAVGRLRRAGAVFLGKTETTAFVVRATQSYRRREAIVQELARGEIADTSTGAFNSWLANEAGFPKDQERADLIKKIAEQSRIASSPIVVNP